MWLVITLLDSRALGKDQPDSLPLGPTPLESLLLSLWALLQPDCATVWRLVVTAKICTCDSPVSCLQITPGEMSD